MKRHVKVVEGEEEGGPTAGSRRVGDTTGMCVRACVTLTAFA